MKRKILLSATIAMLLGTVFGFAQDNTVMWGLKASVDAELPSKWHRDGGSITMYSLLDMVLPLAESAIFI